MRLAIVGHREFSNYPVFRKIVEDFLTKYPDVNMIVSGGGRGTDHMAELFAQDKQLPLLVWHAKWREYGKAAGPRRNTKIVGSVDHVLAFLHPSSRGTRDTIKKAEAKGLPVTIIDLSTIKELK